MPRKFVMLGIISIDLTAFMNEAHRYLVVNLIIKSVLNRDYAKMRTLWKWGVDALCVNATERIKKSIDYEYDIKCCMN